MKIITPIMLVGLAMVVQPTIGEAPDKIPKGWKPFKECKDVCGYAYAMEHNSETQKLYCPACCSKIKGKTSYKEGKCFKTVSGFGMSKALREVCYCHPAPPSAPVSKGRLAGTTKSGSNRGHA